MSGADEFLGETCFADAGFANERNHCAMAGPGLRERVVTQRQFAGTPNKHWTSNGAHGRTLSVAS